jgi:hypothetical protein
MKSAIPFLLLASLAAGPTAGQDVAVNDRVFLTTPEGGICPTAQFLQHVTMQIVLACPSYLLIQGFELGLEIENQFNTTFTATFPMPIVDSGPCFPPYVPEFWQVIVGYPFPVPAADTVVLATVDIFYLDHDPLYFRLTGSRPSSVGGEVPAYLAQPGWVVLPMTPYPTAEDWDFAVNAGCTTLAPTDLPCGSVPVETASWGAVKSLYR